MEIPWPNAITAAVTASRTTPFDSPSEEGVDSVTPFDSPSKEGVDSVTPFDSPSEEGVDSVTPFLEGVDDLCPQ